ncbi:5-oxoprolinase subunit PxpB [Mameliella sediminis]|uniref:5-oxoprolinase subunit PxpB n=1 Tax=Mameliella sediminis TaxID=2836866 RepID=UPI001C45CFF1|nr:5-oxoprolinase subunit PxpB [Mameliella sediminis]MBV7396424.1 5-oxoprolinase subunit PxpB [Mameliella sediminis]
MQTRFLPCGDTGLTVEFDGTDQRATNARALQLHAALAEDRPEGLIETVPSYRSLTIHYDPCRTSQDRITQSVQAALARLSESDLVAGRLWRVPVCFEGDCAPDLQEVAAQTGLSPDRIVKTLTEVEQSVYMLGFAPGQPYLGDLPEALSVPRRKNPVPHVPAGSVLTATARTVIYPVDNPTGWYVIGRTPLPLFRPAAQDPVWLKPGDRVRFAAIPLPEFRDMFARRDSLTAEELPA